MKFQICQCYQVERLLWHLAGGLGWQVSYVRDCTWKIHVNKRKRESSWNLVKFQICQCYQVEWLLWHLAGGLGWQGSYVRDCTLAGCKKFCPDLRQKIKLERLQFGRRSFGRQNKNVDRQFVYSRGKKSPTRQEGSAVVSEGRQWVETRCRRPPPPPSSPTPRHQHLPPPPTTNTCLSRFSIHQHPPHTKFDLLLCIWEAVWYCSLWITFDQSVG